MVRSGLSGVVRVGLSGVTAVSAVLPLPLPAGGATAALPGPGGGTAAEPGLVPRVSGVVPAAAIRSLPVPPPGGVVAAVPGPCATGAAAAWGSFFDIITTTRITAAAASKPTAPSSTYSVLLLFRAPPEIGIITAGSAKVAVENTGRSSTEPIEPPERAAGALAPRYDDAIDRMSMRPEPSPPPCCAPPDGAEAACARGLSLAIAARLLSENSTEFSLR